MEADSAGCTILRAIICMTPKQKAYIKSPLARASGPLEVSTVPVRSRHPRRFRYHELAEATNNFADDYKLGQGGFGTVYRGYLTDRHLHVAIKVLCKEPSNQGQKEFDAEVEALTQVRHRNVVQLLGWCNSRHNGLLLVYELMTEGSLDKHLYNPDKILRWKKRY